MRKLSYCILGIFLILILVGFSATVSALDDVTSQPIVISAPSFQSALQNTSDSSEPVSDELGAIRRAITVNGQTWTAEENEITALSDEEFRKMLGVLPASNSSALRPESGGIEIKYTTVLLPDSLDWRNNSGDYTTPVRNQGYCGSAGHSGRWGYLNHAQKSCIITRT